MAVRHIEAIGTKRGGMLEKRKTEKEKDSAHPRHVQGDTKGHSVVNRATTKAGRRQRDTLN